MNKLKALALTGLIALMGCSGASHQAIKVELKDGWQFSQADKNDWLPANVPGCVHTDLMKNGKIEDPFYRLNEHDVQWIDKVNWEYKTTFQVTSAMMRHDRIALDFKGLDTYADVFVNDEQVLSADNMFREWQVDVKDAVKKGQNNLRIVFRSPIKEGIKKYDANGYVIPVSDNDLAEMGKVPGDKKVSVYTRKAGYDFGWDWGPRLVSSGIWRPVYLKAWDSDRIADLHIVQDSVSKAQAEMTAVFEIDAEKNGPAQLTVSNDGKVLATANVNLQKGTQTYPVKFSIQNPKLWWTNGLGPQNMYTINGEVKNDVTTATRSVRIGIRTLKLVRKKDDKGRTFYFELNGVPVFMKGANYIPNDIFPSRVTDANYKKVIETAKESNFNMLRVWGGGIYENNIFYNLCDEAGILVWQDFMFACAMYPGDKAFLDNVKQEAIDNVKRLRNHPSIALWCGNNECLVAWKQWGWQQKEEAKNKADADSIWKSYTTIFHDILPSVVKKYDPSRAYWSSSPSSGPGVVPDLVSGDEHYWGVWWGKEPFSSYDTHLARFMSEYGFQSFPELKTVKQYAEPKDFNIYSDVMKSHQRSSIGNGTIVEYMNRHYRKPKDFESFLYVGQVLQAEGVKEAMEAHRRAMPYVMGSLYWQLNDCWPVASWSSTDYYQRWKALQYFAKKTFSPVLISPIETRKFIKVYVVSDRLKAFEGQIHLQIVDFDGNVLWQKDVETTIKPNASESYVDFRRDNVLKPIDTHHSLLVCTVSENGKTLSTNHLYFHDIKYLPLPKAHVKAELFELPNGYSITLSTDKLAKNVYLSADTDADLFFTDNYFDLLPNEKVTIECYTNGKSVPNLADKLKIQTLADTY
ncbi:beta-mannosidase [Prolixibacter denitrificans]|uniref:Beta-mannosidase B n=1 Tax=Prolixibacter denitrificans TaxID=1541063 RepID=A0A2P8CHV3_9BACT|nr:glycoside hydrolase family 2 protein [Prolixibacter denitrificans]PSK84526.1 beta-mannosidase [Prolixibacter denitrificans]GET20697.1 beta-mannosidase [Prolixibacter denitrificans]